MVLKRKVIQAGIWLQLAKIIQIVANFVVSIILARLLTSDVFGIAGIATLASGILSQFTVLGLTLGIIQKKNISQNELSSIFWLNCIFGLFAASVVIVIAPFAASFYKHEVIKNLLYICTIPFLISPFFQIHRRLQEKHLYFNNIAKIEIITSISSGITGVTLAYFGFGVFSIIIQSVSMSIFYLISTLYFYRWKPDFYLNIGEVKDIIKFSLKMKASHVINYLQRNVDFLILSKLFDASFFGYYSVAYRIMYFPVRRLAYTLNDVLFPTFSIIQDDILRIKRAYFQTSKIITLVFIPISSILAIYPREIITISIGTKWIILSNVLFILSIAGYLQSLESIVDNIYAGINRLSILIKLQIIRTALTTAAVLIGGYLGLFEVCVAITISRILLFTFSLFVAKKTLNINFLELFYNLKRILYSGFALTVFYFFISQILNSDNIFTSLISILTGLILYSFLIYFLEKGFISMLLIMMKSEKK